MAGGVGGEATTSVRWKGRLRRCWSSRADPLERAENRRGTVGAGRWAGHSSSLKLRSPPACDRCVGDNTRRQGPFAAATGNPNSLRAAGILGKHSRDVHSSGLFRISHPAAVARWRGTARIRPPRNLGLSDSTPTASFFGRTLACCHHP